MKFTTRILPALIIAVLATAAGLYSSRHNLSAPAQSADAAPSGAVGKLLALELPDTTGKNQPLSQWKGQVLVVNFWATWCPPCRKEMPAFSAISQKYADKGVQFVGISIDTDENVRKFQAATPVAYPLVVAPPSVVSLSEELGNHSQALPFTLIIDRRGAVGLVKVGTLSEQELERKLAELSRS